MQLVEVEVDEHVRDILWRTRNDSWVRKVRHFRPALALDEDGEFEVRCCGGRACRGFV